MNQQGGSFWRWYAAIIAALMASLLLAGGARAQDKPKTEIVPLIRHQSNLTSVAFSPDGARVLSGGFDKTVKLWDAATGGLLRTFQGEGNWVAVSPDGSRVLGGGGVAINLWDAATGALLRMFEVHSGGVNSVAFSPDGARVLSGSHEKTLELWDAATGALLRSFKGHSDSVKSVAFSRDGMRVLSGSDDKTAKLWDAATGALLRTFQGVSVRAVAFSPDGARVLSGGFDKTLKLWDAATGGLLRTFIKEGLGEVNSVAFSPDGTRVLAGGFFGTLELWDAATGAVLRTFQGDSHNVASVAFSPDGARVLAGGFDGTARLLDADTGELLRSFGGDSSFVTEVAFSPDGARLLSGGRDQTLKLWDAATGALLRTFQGHSDQVNSVAFSPDGARVLSGSGEIQRRRDNTLKLWDAATGRLLRTFQGHSDAVHSVAFSPDGTRVLSGSNDNTMKLWDAATSRLLRTFKGGSSGVNSVAFSPDGTRVLSGSNDNTMKLWDAVTGRLLRTFQDAGWVESVAFSPDSTRVLSGGDYTLKLWDAATGALLRTFLDNTLTRGPQAYRTSETGGLVELVPGGHSNWVSSVAFSPDGNHVLSASADTTVKLWDAATGALLRTFEGHSGAVHSVAFSPDGAGVLSGSADTTVRVWDARTGQLLASLLSGRDGEWLTLTPSGFFSASGKGSELLSIVRGLSLTTIGQVHQSLFSPDLVREALAADPEGEVKRATEVINLDKVLDSGPAPLVEITSNASGSRPDKDLVTVTTRIRDRGKGIGRIEWRVNGVTAAVVAKPAGNGPEYTLTQELALDPAENIIEVVAYNESNLLASLRARTTITFNGPANGTKPKLYVLAIGINSYQDKGYPDPKTGTLMGFLPLKLAADDAKAFGAAIAAAGKDFYETVEVTLAPNGDATIRSLEAYIDTIARKASSRDTFILFAAAHGISEDGRFYLIPQDYQSGPAGTLAKTAIGQDRLQNWIAHRIKAKKALILLDTCESGALVAGHTRSRIDVPSSEASIGRLHEATGRPVLTAAAVGQDALEFTQLGHGVFTAALIDALHHGDKNGDGFISVSELAAHVQELVPKLVKDPKARTALASRGLAGGLQSARFGSRGEDFNLVRRLQ